MKKVIIVNIVAMVVAILVPMAASAATYTPVYIDNSDFSSREDFYNSDSPYIEIYLDFKNLGVKLEQNSIISYSFDMDKSKCCFYYGQADNGNIEYKQLFCYYLDNNGNLKKVTYFLKPYVIDDVRYLEDESKNHVNLTEKYDDVYSSNGYNGMVFHNEDSGNRLSNYSIGRANCPVFSTEEACQAYLESGICDNAVYVPDYMKCEKPVKFDCYYSNDNPYELNIVWKQENLVKNMYSFVEVGYLYNYDLPGLFPSYFENGINDNVYSKNRLIISSNHTTSSNNKVVFNIGGIVEKYTLSDDDKISFCFTCYNDTTDNSYIRSDYAVFLVTVTKNGTTVKKWGTEIDGEDDGYNGQPIKNEQQYMEDNGYSYIDKVKDDSSTNILGYITSGFGLIGDNGLIALLKALLSFVPSWFWSIMASAVGILVLVGLVKLVL